MLAELRIRNFALIGEAEVIFAEGFNVLTGATGVGKSLVIDALEVLLGGRASPEMIRRGHDAASVEGVFFIPDAALRKSITDAAGLEETHEPEVILHRTITRSGRNRCRLNSSAVNVSALKDAGSLLVDIHGQHEQQSLLYPNKQRELLDDYGRLKPLRASFAATFAEYRRKAKYFEELQATEKQRRSELDFCRFQLAEIKNAALQPGEIEELDRERTLLANAEKILSRIEEGYGSLYEADGSALDILKAVARQLEEIAGMDPRLAAVLDACNEASVKIEDAAFSLREFRDRWQFDPDRLEEIDQRLMEIRKLQSKYGDSEEEIFAFAEGLRQRIGELSSAEEDLRTLAGELKETAAQVQALGAKLTAARERAGAKLAKAVERELKSLGMEKTKFEVAVRKKESPDQATSSGMDDVEFMISANPGESLMSLRKVASGGEISRMMLALKTILAESDKIPLLIFDEVDANIGGRTGRPIGERLASIARCHQVACVTHLPQIASCAAHQLKVSKRVTKGETFTVVEELRGDARLHEIAEMIGGKDKTSVTLAQAREMLGAGEKIKPKYNSTRDRQAGARG